MTTVDPSGPAPASSTPLAPQQRHFDVSRLTWRQERASSTGMLRNYAHVALATHLH